MCEYCPFKTAQEGRLRDHIASRHMGVVHTCDECGKVLGSAETLSIHKRHLHNPNGGRICTVCGMHFSRTSDLNVHVQGAHPDHLSEEQRRLTKNLVCAECNIQFTRHGSLRRHVELKHGDGTLYPCPDCGRGFPRRYLRRHRKSKHQATHSASGVTSDSSSQL
jgi:ssDNA-binding Zn-finger/Zn-ribbon topoisomerase 1